MFFFLKSELILLQAYILINCEPGFEKSLITSIKGWPEVSEINGIWGKYDILVKISTSEFNGIDRFIEKLRKLERITGTYTMHVLYGQGGSIDD